MAEKCHPNAFLHQHKACHWYERTIEYVHNQIKTTIRPSTGIGRATIHDKDIWIYCISKLMQAVFEKKEINQTVRFTIYDYLVTTNRETGGINYERTKDSLDRLAGTRIKIESEDKKERLTKGFGLIDSWTVVERKDGRMIRVEVKLPDWLYHSVANNKVLTLSPDYFRLRKPLDRRIYELSRKHCGNQSEFKISLDLLHKKTGSSAPIRNFRIAIKSLAESNELPDYIVKYDAVKDMVIFKNRNAKPFMKNLFNDNC